jgi:hypothetical protein
MGHHPFFFIIYSRAHLALDIFQRRQARRGGAHHSL